MKIIYGFFYFFVWIFSTFASTLKDDMFPESKTQITWVGKAPLEEVVFYVRDFIFDLLYLLVIAVFIFLWAKIITSRGKPDELKKALMWFVYAIIGLAVIPLSYVAVKLISSLNF